MADPRALRKRRLINEYNELMVMNGDAIQIEPLGESPYEKYKITFKVRTIVDDRGKFREKTVCILTIPHGYPKDRPKIAVDESNPPPWHPNWWAGGTWCEGYWTQEESLVSFIYRCAKTIQFSPDYTDSNIDSAANKSAILFWNANKNNAEIIPTDSKPLPIVDMQTPTISIIRTNNV